MTANVTIAAGRMFNRKPIASPRPLGLLLLFQTFQHLERAGRNILVGLVPARLEGLLPVLRPRPAVIIDEPVVADGELYRLAVDVPDVAQAFDVRVAARCVVEP